MESNISEPEPPSPADIDKYRQLLFEGAESLGPDNLHQRVEFVGGNEVNLFRYYESNSGKLVYPIEAYVCLRSYQRAVAADRWQLQDDVTRAMDLQAQELDETRSLECLETGPVSLMNNMPMLIEPGRAMLFGDWRSEDEDRIHMMSHNVDTAHQQKILLGGLATFLANLEGQSGLSKIN